MATGSNNCCCSLTTSPYQPVNVSQLWHAYLFFFNYVSSKTLRVWELDVENRKIRPYEVAMGQLKRAVKCIQVSDVMYVNS